MRVQMPDALTGLRPTVDHQAIPRRRELMVARETIGKSNEGAHERGLGGRHISERWNMRRGNNHQVGWRLRVHIHEREQPIRFANDRSWDGPVDDATKWTVGVTPPLPGKPFIL